MKKPAFEVPDIGNVRLFKSVPPPFRRGPFTTKSGGELIVDFALPLGPEMMRRFLAYRSEELAEIPAPLEGLRQYRVVNLPIGRVGGTEFHRIREEVVIGLAGRIHWECEDLFGHRLSVTLTLGEGVWMPPFILHTYRVLEEGSGISVLCNTLFYPDNPATSDTYSTEEFHDLQRQYR